MTILPDSVFQPFNTPPPDQAGMFGGGMSPLQMALSAAAAGYLARTRPGMSQSLMQGVNDQRTLTRQAQLAMLRDNLEFKRQVALAQQAAQLKLQYPDGPLAQALYQSGVTPGSPEWIKAMTTDAQNQLDPVVNAGPYGPVLRSQVAGAANAKPLSDADIDKLSGGQTPPASGGFLGAPYPPIGPYQRY